MPQVIRKNSEAPRGPAARAAAFLHSRWALIGVGVVLLAALTLGVGLFRRGNAVEASDSEYAVQKVDLTISVLEGGNLISDKPDKYFCGVEGRTSIVDIVPDGYIVTPEDVANKKVLVQLDASGLSDRVTSQEIGVQGAEASYKQALLNYDIQKKQNESDISAGDLKKIFAQMDFEKYLGEALAKKVLDSEKGKAEVIAAVAKLAEKPETAAAADCPLAGGSLQTWRQLLSDIDIAGQTLAQAQVKYEWSLKLGPTDMVSPLTGEHGKGYVSRSEVKGDELGFNCAKRDLDAKLLALQIFVQYDFPKQIAQLDSNYTEAGRELDRIKARAEGRLEQYEADVKRTHAQFNTQDENLQKLQAQLKSTQIIATRPGVVVYASSFDIGARWRNPIMAGNTVYERQLLIVMPDPKNMAVEVKVHEASVNKIVDAMRNATPEKPIQARIVLDAFPDNVLWGAVTRVADMPDPQNFMFSPDVKVYNTTVKITDPPEYLKTGMSAKVEMYIANLKDVIAVPVQAVATLKGKRVCYVGSQNGVPTARPVKTGQSNDKFIEIAEGLQVGDRVLLRPPEMGEPAQEEQPAVIASRAAQAQLAAVAPDSTPSQPEAADSQPPAATVARADPANGDKPTDDNRKTPEVDPAKFDITRLLARLPEDQRAAAKKKWDAATAEQRIELIKQWRAAGRARRPQTTATEGKAPPDAPNR